MATSKDSANGILSNSDIAARCLNSIDENKWYEQGNQTDPATYIGSLRQKILRQYATPLNK